MKKAIVTDIGAQAIDTKEPILILFGETATQALRQVSIIQKISEEGDWQAHKGAEISLDDQVYTVTRAGRLAQKNLKELGHVAIVFQAVPHEDAMENALYVTPYDLPVIKKGTEIIYR